MMQRLADNLYTVNSVVQLEQIAIKQYGIPAYELMKRAGAAVFHVISSRYSQQKNVLILCGAGNNAGDGYVVARLAKQSGYTVRVMSLQNPDLLSNQALLAYNDWLSVADSADQIMGVDHSLIEDAELIVDALLGTGLTREVTGEWADCINKVNQSNNLVLSVDIPSGLLADTGAVSGSAIRADITVSFIGLKQGLFTAEANDVCGELVFSDLDLPADIYEQVECDARLINDVDYGLLPKRKASSHKGKFGHVLIVGGNTSMPGAIILSARAALRTGAGLVTILTIGEHLEAISSAVPEAMIRVCDTVTMDEVFDQAFVSSITHVAIGMGLGQGDWSLACLRHCAQMNKPMLIDADALNLIAKIGVSEIRLSSSVPVVITPHPGEAARLLSTNKVLETTEIQADRFKTVKSLRTLFDSVETCIVVLKGSGTIIFDGIAVKICHLGNPAMAAPGLGDVLSGIIIALMAQQDNLSEMTVAETVTLAVCLHAAAADAVVDGKTRGLIASDVIEALPGVLQ
jgi:hydroxyethylthiazole kinase-like uncharacterized protein yjeF